MRVHTAPPVASLAAALLLCLWILPGIATSYHLCPPIDEPYTGGTPCPEQCYEDRQCQSETGLNSSLCCPASNCSQQCVAGVPVPYHPPILACPEIDPDTAGTCTEFCSADSDCSGENQLCCSNSCGHACTTGTLVAPVCRGILESRNHTFRIGEYRPRCDEEGGFSQTQCHGSTGYCWCVRPDSGEPVGRGFSRSPQCNNCSYKGQVYYPGDSFPDDCNTCICSEDGSVGCTEIGCGPIPLFFSCPVLEGDVVGICSEECSSDSDCNGGQKCCSNGCGHTCMDSTPIPFVAPSRECPDYYEHALCDVQECTDSCADPRKLCCQNTCGSQVCIDGDLPQSPCTATVNSLTGGALLGQYVPQCNEDNGTFKTLQCSSHYCWCVDSQSGEPTSDMKDSGDVGGLDCTRCVVDGVMYNHESEVGSYRGSCSPRKCVAGEVVVNEDCNGCEYEGRTYVDGEVVQYYGKCSKKKCVAGELVMSDQCDSCVRDGKIYQHGEDTEKCGLCTCWDGVQMCQRSADSCGDDIDVELEDMEWWHYLIVGSAGLIAILAIVAISLLLVMVVVIRKSNFRQKRLRENSEGLSFEPETQVLFKSGPPEAESVELKVPVEDEDEYPIKA